MALLWHAVNLALLIGIIVYFARRPIRDFMDSRRETIQSDLDEARSELVSAEEKLEACRGRIADLDRELDQIRAMVRTQAEHERDRILAEAESAAARIRGDAEAAVAQELRRAQDRLRAETAELAIQLAADVIQRRVGADDQTRLISDFIEKLDASPAAVGSQGPRS